VRLRIHASVERMHHYEVYGERRLTLQFRSRLRAIIRSLDRRRCLPELLQPDQRYCSGMCRPDTGPCVQRVRQPGECHALCAKKPRTGNGGLRRLHGADRGRVLGQCPTIGRGGCFLRSPRVNVYCHPADSAGRPPWRTPSRPATFQLLGFVPNGEATFCGFASSSGSLTVPNKAGRYPVTRIGARPFKMLRA
jgi:hypothetical protein